ncbi:MAG: MFS transporter [Actinomycetota bacterium]
MSRQQRLTLVATILGSTIVFLDSTVVNVALPEMEHALDTGLAGQQWIVEAYMLALVSLLLVGGAMGDQFGRRRMFVIGLAGFGVTSALCAVSTSTGMLIAARALQGLAGALLVPGSLAIIAATFEGEARGKAVGTWTAWSGIATVVGPAGGGALVDGLSWNWIFWVNLPLIAFTLWLTRSAVPESRDPEADLHIDYAGIGLSALGLGGPVFALIEQPTYGWGDPLVFIPLLAGVASFAAFVAHEVRTEHPMLDMSLFRVRNFAIANLTTLTAYAGLIGAFFFITLFLQQSLGYTALEAGFATTPVSLLLFVLSPRFGRITSGTGPRLPMTFGPIVGGIGLLMLTRLNVDSDYLTGVLPAILVFGLGLSATVAPLTATVLDSVEERHVGVASGINNAVARVAGLLAIAVLGAVIAGQFGSTLDNRLAGVRLSPAGQQAIEEVRSEALAGSQGVNIPQAEEDVIAPAIDDASESGFHLALLIAGVLMIVGGVVSGVGIRNPERPPERIREPPRAAPAGECGRPHSADVEGLVPGALSPAPVGAGPGPPDPAL